MTRLLRPAAPADRSADRADHWAREGSGESVRSVPQRFGTVARGAPGAVALRDEAAGRILTYGELDEASRVTAAALLDRLGPEPGRIAVVPEGTGDFLVAALGVFRAGKTMVAIEPGDPDRRRVLEHAAVELVIEEREHPDPVPGAESVSLGALTARWTGRVEDHPVEPSVIAQIVYTSGTSGTPKAVAQSHAYVLAKARWDAAFFGFSRSDRLTQLLSLAFAASQVHVFGALLAGGELHAFDVRRGGLGDLGRWLRSARITGVHMTPSLFRRFAAEDSGRGRLERVRYVLLGGEAGTGSDLEAFRMRFGSDALLVHQLAATEVGTIARSTFDPHGPPMHGVLPTGAPADGKTVKILGEDDRPADVGRTGEIVVRTADPVDGYWRPSGEVAPRFVVHPGGGGTYRTGDRGRVRPDGLLEHLGRLDGRVKVRGYAVDVTEVRNALLALDWVREAVVRLHEPPDRDPALVAYLVPRDGIRAGRDPREPLRRLLPEYAIPTYFLFLEEIPRTPRGKVDLHSLPPPSVLDLPSVRVFDEAADGLERTLAEIWKGVLGLERIGVTESFQDLGGSSIQLLELAGAIGRSVGVDISPTLLFERPTIRSLADAIRSGAGKLVSRSVVPVRAEGDGIPFFCVHGRRGDILFLPAVARHMRPGRPVYGIQAEGFEGPPPPPRSVGELAEIYVNEVRRTQPAGPYLLGGYSLGGHIAMEMARQLAACGESVSRIVLLDTFVPRWLRDGGPRGSRWDAPVAGGDPAPGPEPGEGSRFGSTPLRRYASEVMERGIGQLRRAAIAYHVRAGKRLPHRWGLRRAYFREILLETVRTLVLSPVEVPLVVLSQRGAGEFHRLHWGPLARKGLEVVELPGDHGGIIREPAVRVLARHLDEALSRADPLSPGPHR